MVHAVVFKCTRLERDGGHSAGPLDQLDCYWVANCMFDTIDEAKDYAQALPLFRQARVMTVAEFRCPRTGEWIANGG